MQSQKAQGTRLNNAGEARVTHTLSSLLGMSKISDINTSNINQSSNKHNRSACTTPKYNASAMTPLSPKDNSFHTDFHRDKQFQIVTSRSSHNRNQDSERLATVRQRRDRRLRGLKSNAASLKFLPMAHLPTPTDQETNV